MGRGGGPARGFVMTDTAVKPAEARLSNALRRLGDARHRQTKGAETDMLGLTPPRHTPTLPTPDVGVATSVQALRAPGGPVC